MVVDGDVDGSAAVVDREARGLQVRALVLPENRGRAAALNAGFAAGDRRRCWSAATTTSGLAPEHLARHARPPRARPPGRTGTIGLCRNVLRAGQLRPGLRRAADGPALPRTPRTPRVPPSDGATGAPTSRSTAETWRRVGPYDETLPRLRLGGRRLGIPAAIGSASRSRSSATWRPSTSAAASTSADRALRAFYSGAASGSTSWTSTAPTTSTACCPRPPRARERGGIAGGRPSARLSCRVPHGPVGWRSTESRHPGAARPGRARSWSPCWSRAPPSPATARAHVTGVI